MLTFAAEFETNLRSERQLEGIAKAKAEGVYMGRKSSIDVVKVKALRESVWAQLRSRNSSKLRAGEKRFGLMVPR
jgi:DNA invertase Pin-like site-specific DNA recombinase